MPPKKQRPSVAVLNNSGIIKERKEQVLRKFAPNSNGKGKQPVMGVENLQREVSKSNDSTVSTGSVEPDLSDLIQLNGDAAPIPDSYSTEDQQQYHGSFDPSALSHDGTEETQTFQQL